MLNVHSPINRICIIGCCGGGKSTLAKTLAAKLDLPHRDLDDLFWHEDWVLTPKDQQPAVLTPIIAEPRWLIDSNYAGCLLAERFRAADLIIHIDLPTWFCIFRIARRSVRQFLGWEKSLPARIQQAHKTRRQRTLSDWSFYRYVYKFKRRFHPAFNAALDEADAHHKYMLLSSRKQIQSCITQLTSE